MSGNTYRPAERAHAATDGLELRIGYLDHRPSFLALADLLDETFGIDIRDLDRFGGPDPSAVAFGYFDREGRCVANFSSFDMVLLMDGVVRTLAGYQSGAVRPAYRGRGLYQDLMRRAFSRTAERGLAGELLLTDKPALYGAHGFSTRRTRIFRGQMPELRGRPEARHLSLEHDADLRLVREALESRTAPSLRFSVLGPSIGFLLNAAWDSEIRLSHLPGLAAIAVWREAPGVLQLLDIVAPDMPPLNAVLDALGIRSGMVEVLFAPDRIGWAGEAVYQPGACLLMERLSDGLEGGDPIAFSPINDF
jgi:GNAT superfamily N-acetyltransferase